ncbi:restriction endonuclease subunit S [Pseudomonas protegens]|uniref:restriction endonuclease subunit S n=1 Tax=Pseudomonas protegens TaxID=380021 RepID=UPI001C8DEA2D|nr:restriction endonuclease subunit S [Pseudomonas protegens]QZI69957.1 restriction endonuclease subunit S [Pseudomonas protegens]
MSWPQVRLESIFDIARGGSPRPIDDYITDADDGLNWISIKDASNSNKYIETTRLKIKREGLSRTRMVKPGDFLLTNSMSFGRPYIMKTTGCIHDGWLVLSGDPEKVDSDYFYHLLGSDLLKRRFSALAAGAVVKNLNIDLVKGVEIPLPPLPEQKRIATILDKADAIRSKRQRAIQLADDFLRAVFLDMFGELVTSSGYARSQKYKLLELVDYIDYRGKTPEKSEYGIPLITAKNVKNGYVDDEPREYIPEENYGAWMTRGFPRRNDVLFTTEAPLGNVALLGEYEKVAIGQRLVALRSKGKVTHEYLLFLLLHPFVQDLIYARSSGSTVKGIRTKELYAVELPVPDMEKQREFSAVYWKSKSLTSNQESARQLDMLNFSALSQKAFAGQL